MGMGIGKWGVERGGSEGGSGGYENVSVNGQDGLVVRTDVVPRSV